METPKWRRVADYGQPPAGERLLIREADDEPAFIATGRDDPNFWHPSVRWCPVAELNLPTEDMPAPLPKPWRPLDELDGCRPVQVHWVSGRVTVCPADLVSDQNITANRIDAWCEVGDLWGES